MPKIWTSDVQVGRQYPDAIDPALRLRANHILPYLDDNDATGLLRAH